MQKDPGQLSADRISTLDDTRLEDILCHPNLIMQLEAVTAISNEDLEELQVRNPVLFSAVQDIKIIAKINPSVRGTFTGTPLEIRDHLSNTEIRGQLTEGQINALERIALKLKDSEVGEQSTRTRKRLSVITPKSLKIIEKEVDPLRKEILEALLKATADHPEGVRAVDVIGQLSLSHNPSCVTEALRDLTKARTVRRKHTRRKIPLFQIRKESTA